MSLINHLLYEPAGGQFREYVGLNAFIDPTDQSLYRKLLPKPFEVPSRPVVMIFAADYLQVASWPLTRYQEWAVLLKCIWKGSEGWHCITMPVTKWLPMFGGRRLGFPKFVVDSISLEKQGQGWTARSFINGDVQFQMEFQPGLTRPLSKWESELVLDEAFFKQGDTFLLFPPSQGPQIKRIHLDYVAPAQWAPEAGMVQITVNREEPWADLIPEGNYFPGTFNHFKGGVNLVEQP
jgi:hypothetical protein